VSLPALQYVRSPTPGTANIADIEYDAKHANIYIRLGKGTTRAGLSPREHPWVQESVVELDVQACDGATEVLPGMEISADKEASSLTGFSHDQAGNFYLLLVAISPSNAVTGRDSPRYGEPGRPRGP
jgi:hypothetical protein